MRAVLLLALLPLAVAAPTDWTVFLHRIGPIHIGMTVAEANRVAALDLQRYPGEPVLEGCTHVYPAGDAAQGLAFMTWDDQIVRVAISAPPYRTRSGVGVGSTAAEVRAAYPGQIDEAPHAYTDGAYLSFTPRDAADQAFGLVFEVAADTVSAFRIGRADAVRLVEGCA